jgi:hypothetical protein
LCFAKIKDLGLFPAESIEGDQIGRFFAYWAIVYFGLCFENYRNNPNYLATFCHGYALIFFKKKLLGYILGDFSQTHLVTLKVLPTKSLSIR